jgi:hypothetical protein
MYTYEHRHAFLRISKQHIEYVLEQRQKLKMDRIVVFTLPLFYFSMKACTYVDLSVMNNNIRIVVCAFASAIDMIYYWPQLIYTTCSQVEALCGLIINLYAPNRILLICSHYCYLIAKYEHTFFCLIA